MDVSRACAQSAPLRPLTRLSRPRRTPEPTATARIGRAPRRGWRRRDQSTCCPATRCSTYDSARCLTDQSASRPCSRAPARQARRPAEFRAERRAGWEARRCGTAPRWPAHVRRGRGGERRWRSGWQTPRAPHRLAHVAQPICITREAVPDGSAWFRVVLIFRPSASRPRGGGGGEPGERSEPTHEKSPAGRIQRGHPQPEGSRGNWL